MTEKRLCECGCRGETLIPEGWNRYNRYIRGHTKKKFPRLKVAMLLGHPIPKGAEVHHHYGQDDATKFEQPSELVLCENRKYHCFLHIRRRAYFGIKIWKANNKVNSQNQPDIEGYRK